MAKFIPPNNFGMVEEDLYRSGEPSQLNFPFLEKLKLKTIIYLAPDEPSKQFQEFVQEQGICFVHLGLDGSKTPWKPVSEKVVIAALNSILDSSSYPLHIMCHLGRHRTGTVIGCLRKVQRWNVASILAEYRRYAGSKVRLMNEQFIELFDTDLIRGQPERPPPWWRSLTSSATPATVHAVAVHAVAAVSGSGVRERDRSSGPQTMDSNTSQSGASVHEESKT